MATLFPILTASTLSLWKDDGQPITVGMTLRNPFYVGKAGKNVRLVWDTKGFRIAVDVCSFFILLSVCLMKIVFCLIIRLKKVMLMNTRFYQSKKMTEKCLFPMMPVCCCRGCLSHWPRESSWACQSEMGLFVCCSLH